MEKKTKKYLMIGAPILAAVLLISISLSLLLGSSTRVAFLNIEEGTVQVDTGNGWETAVNEMSLSLKDKIKTLDGRAVLVLYESIIIELDKNTEVAIEQLSKDNVKVYQSSGSTWNKFTAIMGIQNFEVETPTTVATVRGTEFWDEAERSVGVELGLVDVKMGNKLMKVGAQKKAVMKDGETTMEDFDDNDRRRAIEKKKIMIKHLKKLRSDELKKHSIIYSSMKRMKNWTDADVQRFMDRMDDGEFNPEELKQKAKIPAKSLDKFEKLSKEIIKNIKEQREMEQKSGAASAATNATADGRMQKNLTR